MRCLSPIYLPEKKISVPCGRCAACVSRNSLDWSSRLRIQSQYSKSSYWVTLSYENYFLPVIPVTGDCSGVLCRLRDISDLEDTAYPTLYKSDLTGFLDRFRHRKEFKTLKYFAVGEYGNDPLHTHRPHYHIIMFFNDYIGLDNMYDGVTKSWMMDDYCIGNVTVDGLIDEQVFYATGYTQTKDVEFWPNKDYTQKPFRHMSKRLGIDYVLNNRDRHPDLDPKYHNLVLNGKKLNLPRYFADKLYSPLGKMYYREYLQKLYHGKKFSSDPRLATREVSDRETYIRKHTNRKQQL